MFDTTFKLGTAVGGNSTQDDSKRFNLWNNSKYPIEFDNAAVGEFNQTNRVFVVICAYSPLASGGVTTRVDMNTTFRFKDV